MSSRDPPELARRCDSVLTPGQRAPELRPAEDPRPEGSGRQATGFSEASANAAKTASRRRP